MISKTEANREAALCRLGLLNGANHPDTTAMTKDCNDQTGASSSPLRSYAHALNQMIADVSPSSQGQTQQQQLAEYQRALLRTYAQHLRRTSQDCFNPSIIDHRSDTSALQDREFQLFQSKSFERILRLRMHLQQAEQLQTDICNNRESC